MLFNFMQRVPIRDLQRQLYRTIKSIPLIITRRDMKTKVTEDLLIVFPYDERLISHWEYLKAKDAMPQPEPKKTIFQEIKTLFTPNEQN
jgi:hypothetical protein